MDMDVISTLWVNSNSYLEYPSLPVYIVLCAAINPLSLVSEMHKHNTFLLVYK